MRMGTRPNPIGVGEGASPSRPLSHRRKFHNMRKRYPYFAITSGIRRNTRKRTQGRTEGEASFCPPCGVSRGGGAASGVYTKMRTNP